MNDLERHPGINMATPTPDSLEPTVSNWRDVGAAVAVTLILSQSVIHSWHAYLLFDKCIFVVVLLYVLTLPWEGIRMKKRTHNVEVSRVYFIDDGLFSFSPASVASRIHTWRNIAITLKMPGPGF